MKDKRRKPRWLQHIKAFLLGYFWLPCPICHQYFGGHESDDGGHLVTSPTGGKMVCANCVEIAKERNVEFVTGIKAASWDRPLAYNEDET